MEIFDKRKQDILGKKDKSFIGGWDKKIIALCEKLNKSKNYYSTSSCSGRIVLIIDSNKKTYGLFLKIHHTLISLSQLKRDLNEIIGKSKGQLIIFKQEPCGLHVACRSLKDAQVLVSKARKNGWKKSGIISSDKRFIVEMFGTGKLEFPIIKDCRLLVDERFLKEILKKSNKNLKKSWKQINSLKKSI